MDDVRSAEYIQQERESLHRQREEVYNQQQQLENRLAAINREFEAIDAYETANCSFQGTAFLLRIDPLKQLNRRSRAGPGNMDYR